MRLVSEQVAAFSTEDQGPRQIERELRDVAWSAFDAEAGAPTTFVDFEIIPQTEPLPIKSARFGSEIQERHHLPAVLVTAWNTAVKEILRSYNQAAAVASTSSAHVRVWEAAIASLHHRYMAEPQSIEGLSPLLSVEEAALAKARKNCGAPSTPKADQRFKVEGCWTTIHIRFLLVQLAQGVFDYLRKKGLDTLARTRWADFIAYILASIRRDASLTLEVAEKSRSYRQVMKTVILKMEAEFQTFSHRVKRERNALLLKELRHEAKQYRKATQEEKASQANRYRLLVTGNAQGNEDWLGENFIDPAQRIIDNWATLIEQLKKGVVYVEVSDQEKRDILKAFMSGFLGFSEFQDRLSRQRLSS